MTPEEKAEASMAYLHDARYSHILDPLLQITYSIVEAEKSGELVKFDADKVGRALNEAHTEVIGIILDKDTPVLVSELLARMLQVVTVGFIRNLPMEQRERALNRMVAEDPACLEMYQVTVEHIQKYIQAKPN